MPLLTCLLQQKVRGFMLHHVCQPAPKKIWVVQGPWGSILMCYKLQDELCLPLLTLHTYLRSCELNWHELLLKDCICQAQIPCNILHTLSYGFTSESLLPAHIHGIISYARKITVRERCHKQRQNKGDEDVDMISAQTTQSTKWY